MRSLHIYHVIPSLPEKLDFLGDLVYNLMWTWNSDMIELFRRIDRDLWDQTYHNPVLLLGMVKQDRLQALAEDDGFIAHLERMKAEFDQYMKRTTWFQKKFGDKKDIQIAYFCAEFGITDCLPIYSGGLGVLAGEHLKSASDLGIPLVGVGLLYQQGYFRQYLNVDGWQQERYPVNDFYNLPVKRLMADENKPLTVEVAYPGRTVAAHVWKVQVGRIPLFLLDTNIPANNIEDQKISNQLYGGDLEMRMKQELLLGIGGIRALKAMGVDPSVFHMNEGHSSFLALERIRLLMEEQGMSFKEAKTASAAGNVFTTHTPVPAGFDVFPPEMMERYLGSYVRSLGLNMNDFMAMGRVNPADAREHFNMAYLAVHQSSHLNGVSKLHSKVSREMWQDVWPGLPISEIPITSVTNGVHSRSWISAEMEELFDRYLGSRWKEKPGDHTVWQRIEGIPDEELWRTHERRRERLVAFARSRLYNQLLRRGANSQDLERAKEALDPNVLTIGFARRFATYKRATLLMKDAERITRLLSNPERPIQLVFAGKAHPKDNAGKELIKQIVHFAQSEDIKRRIVFLENYDLWLARTLVMGVDLWLNNPRRPMEASGTSGMKVLPNGGINCSILDGWWAEAYNMENGWAIGHGEDYDDFQYQDRVESSHLYNLLEKEIIPMFYERGPDKLPRRWIAKMKASMSQLCPVFNTSRMVQEYTERFYIPASEHYHNLSIDSFQKARQLSDWKEKVRKGWPQVQILRVDDMGTTKIKVGHRLNIRALVRLGELAPEDVEVQVFYGPLDPEHRVSEGLEIPLDHLETDDNGNHVFIGEIPCDTSGMHGYAVRILPKHVCLANRYGMRLITWE